MVAGFAAESEFPRIAFCVCLNDSAILMAFGPGYTYHFIFCEQSTHTRFVMFFVSAPGIPRDECTSGNIQSHSKFKTFEYMRGNLQLQASRKRSDPDDGKPPGVRQSCMATYGESANGEGD